MRRSTVLAAATASAFPVAHREPSTAGARSVDLDQAIDARGRTRRVERTAAVATFGGFGPAETFTGPGPLAD
ncbi:hypothetical protein ACFC6U_07420 [Kitasatospora purpeofusca]|uniref:hypothetical protein n=1 Tax=Kitasatospora TaxID=2063 RepID=UPI0005BE2AAC|nr:hypothetical protein [Kitasatospora sp. MBT66]